MVLTGPGRKEWKMSFGFVNAGIASQLRRTSVHREGWSELSVELEAIKLK